MSRILIGDALIRLREMPDETVQCCVTSPPYWGLRDYGVEGQLGLEKTPEAYISKMVEVFREVRRVLRNDGTLWLNMGDSYANDGKWGGSTGLKPKDLVGIPWMLAFALRADGWYLRQDIIWSKPNPMPESVTDRCTKSHEYIFMLTKSSRYFYDQDAIKEPASLSSLSRLSQDVDNQEGSHRVPGKTNGTMKAVGCKPDKQRGHSRRHAGFNDRWDEMERTEQCSGMRNKRSVWNVATQPYSDAHFATFPEKLIEPCILAGTKEGDTVLDPFCGSGTTGVVAQRYQREFVGIELNPKYAELAEMRIGKVSPLFNTIEVCA